MVSMSRKNHQKQVLIIKSSLEEESRSKNDQVRLKKGNEAKIQDLEEQTEQLKKVTTTVLYRIIKLLICVFSTVLISPSN